MAIDLKDVTFNIPVRIEHPDRSQNLNYIIDWLLTNFNTNIMVYEVGEEQKWDNHIGVQYTFEKHKGPFHRTRYLNNMARTSKTPYIANYDCDVVFPNKQIVKAVEKLRSNDIDGIYPYSGYFVNIQRDEFFNTLAPKFKFDDVNPDLYQNFGKNSVGGAIIWNKDAFIAGGMENEKFVSWGCEDWERLQRYQTLGYRIGRVTGPLYHIEHFRSNDSNEGNPFYNANCKEFDTVLKMNKLQLLGYIKTWPWLK